MVPEDQSLVYLVHSADDTVVGTAEEAEVYEPSPANFLSMSTPNTVAAGLSLDLLRKGRTRANGQIDNEQVRVDADDSFNIIFEYVYETEITPDRLISGGNSDTNKNYDDKFDVEYSDDGGATYKSFMFDGTAAQPASHKLAETAISYEPADVYSFTMISPANPTEIALIELKAFDVTGAQIAYNAGG